MKTQSNKQKLYCYVDETGQDTMGKIFIVSVVIVEKDREKIEEELIKIEKDSKKGKTKWQKTKFYQRESYINQVCKLNELKKSIYYSKYDHTIIFYELITYAVTKVIFDKASDNYQANIIIDGLPRSLENKLSVSFRKMRVKTNKVKGARDESSALIRLADALSGLIRDSYENQKWAKEKLNLLNKNGFIKNV